MKYKKEVFRSMSLLTQLGISVMVPVFLCIAIGLFADKKLGTSFITLIMLVLGIAAGGRNAYILAKGVINENERDKK